MKNTSCYKIISVALSFLLIVVYACKDVDGLSDAAEITGCRLISHTPQDILLGEVSIQNDTVYIPLLQGKYSFPLTVYMEFDFSPSIDKIIGEHTKFVFEYDPSTGEFKVNNEIGKTASFCVIAESGAFKRWYVTLKEAPYSEDAGISRFRIKNYNIENSLFCPFGVIDNIDTLVSLFYINSVFPREIVPDILLSAGALMVDTAKTLVFETETQEYGLSVISASGNLKEWKVNLKKAELIDDISELPVEERKRLGVEKQEIKMNIPAASDMRIDKTSVDEDQGIIRVFVHKLNYPVSLDIEYGKLLNRQIVGLNSGEAINFTASVQSMEFYVLDEISKKVRKWYLQVEEATDGSTEIYGLKIKNIQSNEGILIAEPEVRIEPDNHTVWIDLPSVQGISSITMEVEWELPAGAGIQEPSQIMAFSTLTENKVFTITNGSSVQPWTIRLNFPPLSNEAEILSFDINRISGGTIFSKEKFRINPQTGTIRLLMEDVVFPFTIEPEITLSEGASLEGISSFQPVSFNHWEEIISFYVKAESGLMKQWQIELLPAPQLQDPLFLYWKEAAWYSSRPNPSGGRLKDSIPVYWSTANNSVVQGTSRAGIGEKREGVKLTTSKNISFVKAIAAGTVFLGKFNFNLSDVGEPKKMTNFGIPFTAKPVAVEVEVEYTAGPVLERLNKEADRFEVIPDDKDRGIVWVELLHWNGQGSYSYHGDPVSSITVLGRGEYELEDTNGMINIKIPVNYYNHTLKPTHITVVMSSGSRGDDFIGAVGSTLKVNNVRLLY
jgi:hypothetical protein